MRASSTARLRINDVIGFTLATTLLTLAAGRDAGSARVDLSAPRDGT